MLRPFFAGNGPESVHAAASAVPSLFTAAIGSPTVAAFERTAPLSFGMKRAAIGRTTARCGFIALKSGEAGSHENVSAVTLGGTGGGGAPPSAGGGTAATATFERQRRRVVSVRFVRPVGSV